MLWREHQKHNSEERVEPRGECHYLVDVARVLNSENYFRALAATNPVALHPFNRFGPVDHLQIGKQPLRVSGNFEIPLLQILFADFGTTAPAATCLNLFVGKNGFALRAPPLAADSLIGQTAFKKQQEKPLRPMVVFRRRRVNLSVPVVRGLNQFHLPAVIVGIALGRHRGVYFRLDRVIFRRQAERIPSHRMENVVSFHTHVTRDDAGGDVIAAMSHRQAIARRIWEEIQDVILRLVRIRAGFVQTNLLPIAPPFGFDCFEVVTFVIHRRLSRVCEACKVEARRARPPSSLASNINRFPQFLKV